MERYSKVGMQELDQRLSKIVEAARKKPVSVYRYGAPWVWIVSQDDWQGALKRSPATFRQAIRWCCCARRSTTCCGPPRPAA
jgi:PHD/YefM family antitoxin component YafN of YafNO toxin-antitoxin module